MAMVKEVTPWRVNVNIIQGRVRIILNIILSFQRHDYFKIELSIINLNMLLKLTSWGIIDAEMTAYCQHTYSIELRHGSHL